MPAALKGSVGASVTTANNVPTSVTLTPALPAHASGDLLLCFTSCRLGTPTVATPSGWTLLANVAGANGRLALFGKIATSGSEAAPGCAWSGLTSGVSGSPAQAQCAVFTGSLITVDVVGAVENGAASTNASASGTALTTLTDNDMVLALSTRQDDVGTWSPPAGFTAIGDALSSSGLDMSSAWAFQVKAAPGSVAPADFSIAGGSSFASSGVLVALKPILSVQYFGAMSLPITFGKEVSGVVRPRYYSSLSLPIAFSAFVDGKKKMFGAISLPIIFAKEVTGSKKTFGQVALPIIFSKDVRAVKRTFGQVSKAFFFGATTQARRRTYGKIDVSIVFGKDVAGTRQNYRQNCVPDHFSSSCECSSSTYRYGTK